MPEYLDNFFGVFHSVLSKIPSYLEWRNLSGENLATFLIRIIKYYNLPVQMCRQKSPLPSIPYKVREIQLTAINNNKAGPFIMDVLEWISCDHIYKQMFCFFLSFKKTFHRQRT
jgi:hypothetical protein